MQVLCKIINVLLYQLSWCIYMPTHFFFEKSIEEQSKVDFFMIKYKFIERKGE